MNKLTKLDELPLSTLTELEISPSADTAKEIASDPSAGPKDPTAAERQRRYRERKRDADRNADRNARDVTLPSPTARRHMLIEGAKEFQAKYPEALDDAEKGKTAEELVDDAIAKEIVSLRSDGDENEPVSGADVTVLCARQDEITAYISAAGDLVITQKAWPDEDNQIIVSKANVTTFIDLLCDVIGIPSCP